MPASTIIEQRVKAFGVFNTGTQATLQAVNLSLSSSPGVGQYRFTMSAPMANTNYSIFAMIEDQSTSKMIVVLDMDFAKTTTQFQLRTNDASSGISIANADFLNVLVIAP